MCPVRTLTTALFLAAATLRPFPALAEVSDRFGQPLKVEQQTDRLVIKRDFFPVATYVYRDEHVRRPYFANVHAPSGLPITRAHPPRPGLDAVDHADMHPGIWLAFGDISSQDFWRNKGRVEHVEFVNQPEAKLEGQGSVVTFAVKNRYVASDRVVCQELARHSIRATQNGFLFLFDSEFSSEQPFAFGDQEEMGLGVRLATPVIVKGGTGAITNSEGASNEKAVWGRQAEWCDYSGVVAKEIQPRVASAESERKLRAGLLVVPHPANFRRSWMHARDYGLLVANPFGQRAFTKGKPSQIEVQPGTTLRLRYGVWAYAANLDAKLDLAAMAAEYERQSALQ